MTEFCHGAGTSKLKVWLWFPLSMSLNGLLLLFWRSLIDFWVWSIGLEGAKPSEGGWEWSFAFMGEFGADEPNWTLPTGRFRTSTIASGMLQGS